MTAATSCQGQQNEGSSQPSGAAEQGQEPTARGSRTAAASRQGQQNESSQPPGAAKRGQKPAARGSRMRAAAGRQERALLQAHQDAFDPNNDVKAQIRNYLRDAGI